MHECNMKDLENWIGRVITAVKAGRSVSRGRCRGWALKVGKEKEIKGSAGKVKERSKAGDEKFGGICGKKADDKDRAKPRTTMAIIKGSIKRGGEIARKKIKQRRE